MAIVSAHSPIAFAPLPGGVSSEIFRIDLPDGPVCVKRALPKLKVAADWRVPVERNRCEVEWMRVAGDDRPRRGSGDPRRGSRDRMLRDGVSAAGHASGLEGSAARRHVDRGPPRPSATRSAGFTPRRRTAPTSPRASRPTTSSSRSGSNPISSRPRRAHPELAPRARRARRDARARTKRVLVHGDFSPKNLLIGPAGPVILDAECAWYGDPAFDLAFVLNHLLLKGAWQPAMARALRRRVRRALAAAYLARVAWEPRDDAAKRARRRCCRGSCSPASTASRRSST